jgi:hypothetical protein
VPLFHHPRHAAEPTPAAPVPPPAPEATVPAPVPPPRAVPFRAGGSGGIAPETAAPAVTFSGTHTLLADISEFQSNIADAAYLAWSKGVIVRAAYGDAHDDGAWYGGARRAALHKGGALFLGIYQFLVAGQDGAAQANALHALVGGLQKGEVLIADFEQGAKPMLTAWYNRMEALGYPAKYLWTYTGRFFGEAQGVLPVQWLADYSLAEPAGAHTLWQFTDRYPVPGVGTCDASVFHGPMTALAALAYPGSTPAPPPVHVPATEPTGLRQTVKSAGSAVTFTWYPVAGHRTYSFQLETYKPGFGWVLSADQQVTGTTRTETVPPASQCRWRVSAGTWTGWEGFSTP